MKNTLLALFVVPLLTVPAFAGSLSAGDKPMIVAEDVGVEVGNVVGFGVGEIAFGLQHSAFEQRRINLRDQLSLFDAGIEIHKEMRNRPRNLRADLNRDDGIDRARGLHDLANVPAIRLGGKVLRLVLPPKFKSDEDRGHDYDSDCD